MRIVFMGTPDFAVPCLRQVLEDGYEVAGVFTQPDKPKGRSFTLTPPPVKILAQERGLPVYQPATLRDGEALAVLQRLAPDLIVVVAYGKFLPKEILDLPPLGCVNVHGSLLPKYRGAAPIQWSVINGDPVAGVTTMFMGEGMDTGDMILKKETPIGPEETGGELFDRLAPLGAECLSQTLRLFAEGKPVPRQKQEESQVTYAGPLSRETGRLDLNRPARELHNLVRGVTPWPGASLMTGGKLLKVLKARLADGTGAPGELLREDAFVVACGQGALELVTVQPEGKRPMGGADYLRGRRIKIGTNFITD